MKKLIVKHKVIDTPYSPAVPAEPEKWVKGEEIRLERPMIEVSLGIFEPNEEYTHHEAIAGVPEQPEVSHEEIIAQTQGTDEEIAIWLGGDKHKYPEGYWVEYIDISAQVEQDRINAESLKYLADTDWLIIREVDASIACPADVKQLRAEARAKIVR